MFPWCVSATSPISVRFCKPVLMAQMCLIYTLALPQMYCNSLVLLALSIVPLPSTLLQTDYCYRVATSMAEVYRINMAHAGSVMVGTTLDWIYSVYIAKCPYVDQDPIAPWIGQSELRRVLKCPRSVFLSRL